MSWTPEPPVPPAPPAPPTLPAPPTHQPEPEPQIDDDATGLVTSRSLNPLITEAAAALAAAAELALATPDRTWSTWTSAHLEWSQAGPQHSGRACLRTPEGPIRLALPDSAVVALSRLRAEQTSVSDGAWLAAQLTLLPDGAEPSLETVWQERPYWNASGLGMVPAPGEDVPASPVPTDEQWLADLRHHPRSPERVPQWLRESNANPGAASAALRQRLSEAGYPGEAVLLPGEQATPYTLEGAMEVRALGGRFTIGVRDYGVYESFHTTATEREACDWLWDYLLGSPPAPTAVPRYDLEQRSAGYRPAYAQLYAQLQQGGGAMLTTIPAGVALDRIGALDGVFLFPWATPVATRSLPPAAGPNVRLFQIITLAPLTVEAEIVPPWFGQPGGSLRFRIAQDGVGVRQLLLAKSLLEVTVGP